MLIAGCLARRGEHVTVLDADNTGRDALGRIRANRGRSSSQKKTRSQRDRTNLYHKLGFDVIQTNDVILGMPDRIRERYKDGSSSTRLHPMRERCRRPRAADVSIIPASRPSAI